MTDEERGDAAAEEGTVTHEETHTHEESTERTEAPVEGTDDQAEPETPAEAEGTAPEGTAADAGGDVAQAEGVDETVEPGPEAHESTGTDAQNAGVESEEGTAAETAEEGGTA